ncbi:MAG: flagellar biosynthesis protein FlgL, partial [Sphingomonadales bacterium]|nr:flagellar biosynthesis protein FlgL [Sphingomonadales bacterium]
KTDMATLQKRAETLQQELSAGDKLARSSDDPVAASRLRVLARSDSLSKIDDSNANRANADLTLADSALSTFADYVQRAKELATQAASGTLTTAQRAGIGYEIQQIYGNLVSLANSRDSNGHSLFGGEAPGDAYTLDASGNASYVGTASSGDLALGDGQSITRGLTGPEFLSYSVNGSSTDLLAVVKGLADDLQGGSADPQTAARAGMGALDAGLDAITTGQTLIGSRLNWIDLTATRRTNLGELRAGEEQTIGATDLPATIADLQQTMTVLQASQASFAKLASLSLFNVLN